MKDELRKNDCQGHKTMTSLEIARIADKKHKDVMRAIREMEPAWVGEGRRNFTLATYPDAQGKPRPCYQLTKTESLFIITKFRDDARARLILRWEELETENMVQQQYNLPQTYSEALRELANKVEENERLMLENKRKDEKITLDAPKVDYYEEVLQKKTMFTMTDVADELGLSVYQLQNALIENDIIYRSADRFLLKVPYKRWNLHGTRTPQNEHGRPYLVWNERGRMFIHKLYDNGWNVSKAIKAINPSWRGVTLSQTVNA